MSVNVMNISFTDLLTLPDFKLASKVNDTEAMNRILYNLGMDVEKGYELNFCTHRALTTNIPQENYLVMGWERLDDAHIKSGNASLNAIIASSEDESLQKELLGLDPHSVKDFEDEKELGCNMPNDWNEGEEEVLELVEGAHDSTE